MFVLVTLVSVLNCIGESERENCLATLILGYNNNNNNNNNNIQQSEHFTGLLQANGRENHTTIVTMIQLKFTLPNKQNQILKRCLYLIIGLYYPMIIFEAQAFKNCILLP